MVGRFLHASAYDSFCPAGVHQTGDLIAIARLAALIAAGKVEARGDPHDLQRCTVRLASRWRISQDREWGVDEAERPREDLVAIDTTEPWGIAAKDGQTRFTVSRRELIERG